MHQPLATIGYDFHDNDKLALAALGTYTSDLFVERVNNILADRAGIEKDQEEYYQGEVKIENYNTSNPFFLYLAYQNVHVPLEVQPKFEALYPNEEDPARRTYLGMASAVDDSVGRIVNHLKRFSYSQGGVKKNLFEDTVFIFSSDNGGMSSGVQHTHQR